MQGKAMVEGLVETRMCGKDRVVDCLQDRQNLVH